MLPRVAGNSMALHSKILFLNNMSAVQHALALGRRASPGTRLTGHAKGNMQKATVASERQHAKGEREDVRQKAACKWRDADTLW